MIRTVAILLACALVEIPLSAFAAYEDYNKRYGEYRFNKLPEKGAVSKTVWVGQWWSYKKDGVATRFNGSLPGYKPAEEQARWSELSPAEKLDKYLGRDSKIEYDKLKEYLDKKGAIEMDVDEWIEKRRELVYKLNRLIEEHKNESGWKWQDSDEGKEYTELGKKIEEKQKELGSLSVEVDTAFEWEVVNHGNGQFGVQYWWGHCNAWSAAACVEPEPVKQDAVIKDIPFNAGDVKGLLTEAWMECNSSFFGSRCEAHKDEQDRKAVAYNDVTPAAFHIFFADQIGNRDKAFVIDEFTGDEVWNQPVKAYWSKCEPQYDKGEDGKAIPEKVEVKLTNYGGWYGGDPEVKTLGQKEVYPVLCSTSIHWMSDGVAHDAVTAEYKFDAMTYDNFGNGYWVKSNHDDHVAVRTLSYVLWLDKPMDDADARILGDGEWNHGAAGEYAHAHPDFMWQPTGNTRDGGRDYENPFVDYDVLVNEILPLMVEDHQNPEVPAGEYASSDTPIDIPDGLPDDKPGPAITSVTRIDDAMDIHVLEAAVDITHTWIGDLQVSLTAPGGKEEVLKPFGDGSGSDDIKKTFDVKAFNGTSAKGDWTLKVIDQWEADTGKLQSWKLMVK